MSFKVRHDLGKIDELIEIFWIGFQVIIKNIPVVIGVVYQSSSNEALFDL